MATKPKTDYDLIVIGGGPGGYHAAHIAAANKRSVALIECEAVGGTCLNWGCIPTKTLLNIAKQISYSKTMTERGVAGALEYRHEMALQWKDSVIATLRGHVETMLKRDKVAVINGAAQLAELTPDTKRIRVDDSEYTAPNLIIASGAESIMPPIAGLREAGALTSRELLSLEAVPRRLAIIGGGVIGIEFASLFGELGSEVTVFEALPEILPTVDSDISLRLRTELAAQYNVRFFCNTTVAKVTSKQIHYKGADGTPGSSPYDTVLVSVGRRAELAAFAAAGLATTKSGIVVDEQLRANIPGVYAIGDVVGDVQLAHAAYRMAEVAVDTMCDRPARMRYHAIPSVVYAHPELAACGLSEAAAKAAGHNAVSASLPITVSGRAIAEHGPSVCGLCKVVADADSGLVLGAHILAPTASEIIASAAVALEAELRIQELAEVIFPHPTVSEVVRDVAALVAKKIAAQKKTP